MLLTTTSTIEGYTIDEYIGPITAHRVLGSGLFTEFFSSWADFFGVHSRTQQNKLQQVEKAVMHGIREEARARGANAVIGLRVDFDEITGAGKSMMMVTAMGTAIRCRANATRTTPSNARRILASDLQIEIDKQHVIDSEPNTLMHPWTDRIWEFVLTHGIEEVADRVLDSILDDSYLEAPGYTRPREYFRRLRPEKASDTLYDLIESGRHVRFAQTMIVNLQLCSYRRVLRGLALDELAVRRRMLATLKGHAPSYTPDDIEMLQALAAAIERAFPPAEGIEIRRKKLIGAGEMVPGWRCWACERGVSGTADSCDNCGCDRRGFERGDDTLTKTIRIIGETITHLRRVFGTEAVERSVPHGPTELLTGENGTV